MVGHMAEQLQISDDIDRNTSDLQEMVFGRGDLWASWFIGFLTLWARKPNVHFWGFFGECVALWRDGLIKVVCFPRLVCAFVCFDSANFVGKWAITVFNDQLEWLDFYIQHVIWLGVAGVWNRQGMRTSSSPTYHLKNRGWFIPPSTPEDTRNIPQQSVSRVGFSLLLPWWRLFVRFLMSRLLAWMWTTSKCSQLVVSISWPRETSSVARLLSLAATAQGCTAMRAGFGQTWLPNSSPSW